MSFTDDKRCASSDKINGKSGRESPIEEFPAFPISATPVFPNGTATLGRKLSMANKSKSMAQLGVIEKVVAIPDRRTTIEALRVLPVPDSLPAARARAATIRESLELEAAEKKEIRKASINFIKARTASRAAAKGITLPTTGINETVEQRGQGGHGRGGNDFLIFAQRRGGSGGGT